jgi:hypothetical protein
MKGAIIGAVLDHGFGLSSFQFKRYPTRYESYTLGIIRAVYVGGVWQFPVGVPAMDWMEPINHKTVTAKAPMASDEENVWRKLENQDVNYELIARMMVTSPFRLVARVKSVHSETETETVASHRSFISSDLLRLVLTPSSDTMRLPPSYISFFFLLASLVSAVPVCSFHAFPPWRT